MPLDLFAREEEGAGGRVVDARLWQWSYEGSEPHARIGYEANLVDPDAAWLRLTYTASGTPMDYRVRLVTTQPTYGGRRWWFLCPLARQDGGPPRRVAKLYLPPGGSGKPRFHTGKAISQTSPSGRQSKRAVPFNWPIICSMTRLPKPRREGVCTAGPSISVQRTVSCPPAS